MYVVRTQYGVRTRARTYAAGRHGGRACCVIAFGRVMRGMRLCRRMCAVVRCERTSYRTTALYAISVKPARHKLLVNFNQASSYGRTGGVLIL